MQRG
jgi:hypothetical protein